MISQIKPHRGEATNVSPPFFKLTPESLILISFWQVLQQTIGKQKISTQAPLRSSTRQKTNYFVPIYILFSRGPFMTLRRTTLITGL